MTSVRDNEIQPYVLYYNPYSICSLMVLNTFSLKGTPANPDDSVEVKPEVVDIFHEEQFTEHFLCEINDHGQVPVLVNKNTLDKPIADSLEITFWLASKYPDLVPNEEVKQSLIELHALNYFSLSFPGRPEVAKGFEAVVERYLARSDISDRYRKALEFKLQIVKRDKSGGLRPAVTAENEARAKRLLASLDERISSANSWIYGDKPTALDAHLVVFIARMTDVGREFLIPTKLRDYGAWVMGQPAWKDLMQGRKTMVPRPN